MARRFPELELVGVEFEADSVARARATSSRPRARGPDHDPRGRGRPSPARPHEYDLAYFQYALHQLPDAPAVAAPRRGPRCDPGGRLLVLDWPLPSGPDEFRTRHGELIAGVQLDELLQGTALATREQFLAWFDDGRSAGTGRHRPAVRRLALLGRSPGLRPGGFGQPVISIVPVMAGWILQKNA